MVIVSALPTDELLSVGLGQPMAARAFLRGIRRVCFDYHYAAQSGLVQNELEQLIERPLRLFAATPNSRSGLSISCGLVQNELEQLIERPLRLFGVAANLSLANVLQFFQHNAPTMFCGVVHDLFGHHVIFVLCASALLVANLVEQTPLPKTLQIGFLSAPSVFRSGWVKAQMQNFSILRVG